MEKLKIKATVEMAKDGGYCVYCNDEMFSGMGDTLEEAKQDMMTGMDFYKRTCIEEGIEYPSFMDTEYEFVYEFDVQSFLQYYSGIITPAALGKISGINPKQIWSYMHGKSKPRRPQVEKIEAALHSLGSQLMSISF